SLIFSKIAFSFRLVSDCEPLRAPGQVLRASSNKMVRSRRPTAEARSQEAIRRSTSVEGSVAEKPTPMSHGGDGGIQPDSALPLGDQETQEHAKCLGTIFDCSPPAGATLRENKSAQPAGIETA